MTSSRTPQDQPLHRGEPRLLPWLRPSTARGAALTAVAGATVLGGAVVAASAWVGTGADPASPRADAESAVVPVSLHGAPQGAVPTSPAPLSNSGGATRKATSPSAVPSSEPAPSGTPRASIDVTLPTPTVTLTGTVDVPTGGSPIQGSASSGTGAHDQGSQGQGDGAHEQGGKGRGSRGHDRHHGDSPTPSQPPAPLPDLPTPSVPSVSLSVSGLTG